MTRLATESLQQLDVYIERERGLRTFVALSTPILLPILGFLFGTLLSVFTGLPSLISQVFWTGIGGYIGVWAFGRSTIQNAATNAFITTNPMASFFNQNPVVCYGPGRHFCYWWEERDAFNTISLEETAEDFKTEIQTKNGTLTISGSIRLRANIGELHKFVSGAGFSASEITGLVSAHVLAFLENEGHMLEHILHNTTALNASLMRTFKDGLHQSKQVSEFEERFGLIVGDVTIERVLPSQKIQETMGAAAESEIIDRIVARSFGYTHAREVEDAIRAGSIPRKEATHRRNTVLAMSGNLQGMKFEDKNFNINLGSELPPELLKAIAEALPSLSTFTKHHGNV